MKRLNILKYGTYVLSRNNCNVWVVLQSFSHVLMSLQDSSSFLLHAISAHREHRSPSSSYDVSRSRTSHASGGVDSSIPLSICEELILSQSLGSEHEQGATFRSESILMRITRNRSHTRNLKIKFGWQVESKLLQERNDIRANAAVRVASDS